MNGYGFEHGLIWYLMAGLLTGWVASLLVQGRGMGLVLDIAVGMVGGVLGGFLADELGIPVWNFFSAFGISVIGAVLFLMILRALTRVRSKGARAH